MLVNDKQAGPIRPRPSLRLTLIVGASVILSVSAITDVVLGNHQGEVSDSSAIAQLQGEVSDSSAIAQLQGEVPDLRARMLPKDESPITFPIIRLPRDAWLKARSQKEFFILVAEEAKRAGFTLAMNCDGAGPRLRWDVPPPTLDIYGGLLFTRGPYVDNVRIPPKDFDATTAPQDMLDFYGIDSEEVLDGSWRHHLTQTVANHMCFYFEGDPRSELYTLAPSASIGDGNT